MQQTNIPPEILDHIFSFVPLNHKNWSTFKTCSTSRDKIFRGALIRRIYTHIVVTNYRSDQPGHVYSSDLRKQLKDQQIANSIRTLRIELALPNSSRWYNPSVLRTLPRALKKITLAPPEEVPWERPPKLRWSHLHKTFREAFSDCLSSPNLVGVSLERVVEFPLSVFNGCSQLQKISLRQVENVCSPDARFPPQTVSLVINRNLDLPTIVSWVHTSHNLRFLRFASEREDQYSVLLMGLRSDTLTELELDLKDLFKSIYHYDTEMPTEPRTHSFAVAHLPNLRQLAVRSSIYTQSRLVNIESQLPTIARLVATISSLECLNLHVKMDPSDKGRITKSCIWQPLLPLRDSHPSLKHIEMMIEWVRTFGPAEFSPCLSAIMAVPEVNQLCEDGFMTIEES